MKQVIWIALSVTTSLVTLTIIYLLIVYSNSNVFFSLTNLEKTTVLDKKINIGVTNIEIKNLVTADISENEVDSTTPTSTSAELVSSTEHNILYDVPFTPQAPSGNWSDIRIQNGCEETTALMAISWAQGKSFTPEEAEKEIIAIAEYQLENYNHFHDSSAQDTLDRIIRGYFNYDNAEVKFNINTSDIQNELAEGNIIIVPVNGQKLKNPYFTPPGPIEHMIVIIGFDQESRKFIVNDPGTKRGNKIQYSEEIISSAMRDYPTGYHLPIENIVKAMIVVRPN